VKDASIELYAGRLQDLLRAFEEDSEKLQRRAA
jgi:hypothetical protein